MKSLFEIHKNYADNIIVGFARIGGRSVGVIANQPMSLAGVLDVDSSKKPQDSPVFAIVLIFRYSCW